MTIAGIVERLRDPAGPPRTVGALASVLGITIDAPVLAAARCGILEVVARTPGPVRSLRAMYGWNPFGADAGVPTVEDLRERSVDEWTTTLEGGADDVERALRERYGAPRQVSSCNVYDAGFIAMRDGGALHLAFYARLPDWAVPQPDPSVRARVLRELAAAISAVAPAEARGDTPGDTGVVTRLLDALPETSGVKHAVTDRGKNAFSIRFVPGIPSTELVQIFGWQNAAGQCRAMHMTDWEIWLLGGRSRSDLDGTAVARPALGPWTVVAELDRRPTGGPLATGASRASLGGTYRLAPSDVVRVLRVYLGIAGSAPAVSG